MAQPNSPGHAEAVAHQISVLCVNLWENLRMESSVVACVVEMM